LSRFDTDRLRIACSSVAAVCLGGLVYLLILFDFGRDFGRTAVGLGYASRFFEAQAQSFLDGNIALPKGSMGIEGFIVDGRTYMYFGPWPALLRIPMMLVTHDFDGRMTLVSMLVAWLLFAVMAARLVWLVRRCLVPERPVTRLEAVLAGLFLVMATGGTTLTFDASLPWAYHEVYLWQAALVTTAAYWMVRVALEPTANGVRWLALVALATALTRTTGGFGVCLGVVVLALWMRHGKSFEGRRSLWVGVMLAGLVPLLVAIAYNLAKFHHPFMFPLENQVWTDVNAHRREALEVNGGSITGLQFFWTSLVNYFSPGGIRFVDYFPWITLPATNARAHGGAFIDQSYRTGSVTAFMPMLLVMALSSLAVLLRPTKRLAQGLGVRALRIPAAATVLMTGGVMAYGYIAHRYTSEFVPALLLGGAIALWALVLPLAERSRVVAVPLVGSIAVLTAYSLVAQGLTGFSSAAFAYRGPPLDRYLSVQDKLSGGAGSAFAGLIKASPDLPDRGTGSADDLHIRGNCDGLYLNTGDENEPWVVVEERSKALSITFPAKVRAGSVRLFTIQGKAERSVVLDIDRERTAQLRLVNETGDYKGQQFQLTPGEVLRIGMRTDPTIGYLELSSSPGGFVGYIPLQEWGTDWISRIGTVTDLYDEPTVDPRTGIRITPGEGLPLPLCERLAKHNEIALP
jgi:hypothetical protein